jgi:DNA modification methylase
MERIFGESNFRSEIIWQRTTSHNDPKNFVNITDHILYYVKSKKVTWNPQHTPFSKDYVERWYRNVDEKGRYMSSDLASPHPRPNLTYKYKGFNPPANGWKVSLEVMKKLDEEGRLIFPRRNDGIIRRKVYLEKSKGQPLQNLWSDIMPIHAQSKERLGYPTQKPEKLLERIIQASSNPMDIVLDPFCGCGTAIFTAHRIGRQWVGIDISPTACDLMERRMRKLNISPNVMGMPLTADDLRKVAPFEFQNWVVKRLFGRVTARKSGDMGIDGTTFEGVPIQVKQSDDIGRNVIDNFETALRRKKKTKGIVVAFSFGRGAYEEIARAKLNDNLDIKALKIAELLRKQEQQTIL